MPLSQHWACLTKPVTVVYRVYRRVKLLIAFLFQKYA